MRSLCTFQILSLLTLGTVAGGGAPLEIPFQFRDGFIWIDVTCSGNSRPLHFLLDSGAQVSVIDTVAAQRLGVKRGGPVRVSGVGASRTGYWAQAPELRAGAIQLPRRYLMLDLGQLSKACTNAAVDGIIGADFFRDRIVQIDFRNEAIRLLAEPPDEGDRLVLPLKVRACGMLVPVRVNDSTPQWVRLDTGCASALQWVTAEVRPEECSRRVAVALSAFSVPVTQTTVALGSVRFEKVPTDVHTKPIFPGEQGLLGNGLLARFQTVTIDARNGKVILAPTAPLHSK